jgi:hypothetical protein
MSNVGRALEPLALYAVAKIAQLLIGSNVTKVSGDVVVDVSPCPCLSIPRHSIGRRHGRGGCSLSSVVSEPNTTVRICRS